MGRIYFHMTTEQEMEGDRAEEVEEDRETESEVEAEVEKKPEDDSQRMCEEDGGKRGKMTEGAYVLQLQGEAVEKLRAVSTRMFRHSLVPIKTVSGGELFVWVWESDRKAVNKSKREKSTEDKGFSCNVCRRVFTDRRRLGIHKKTHEKSVQRAEEAVKSVKR